MASQFVAPAPWSLNGKGLVLLYHFPKGFVNHYGFLEEYQQKAYRGWLGAVMLVDYKASNVGPYQELLFIPALFRLKGKLAFSISKIYVSTEESRWNGYNNWGIPKETASFDFQTYPDGTHSYQVTQAGKAFFAATTKAFGPSVPFSSRLLPLNRIVQKKEQHLLLTQPQASGQVKLATLKEAAANPDFFPPVQQVRPLATFSVKDFQMRFPQAIRLD